MTADLSVEEKRRVLHAQNKRMEELYPEWMQRYNDCVMETASREELETLYFSAPDPFLQGMVWGVIQMRIFMASLTGVELA